MNEVNMWLDFPLDAAYLKKKKYKIIKNKIISLNSQRRFAEMKHTFEAFFSRFVK
jgi:hypothetical protein